MAQIDLSPEFSLKSSMPLRVSLVNLQKLTLWAWRRAGQHADIGAGGKHPRLRRAQHHDAHLRMLEAQPLDRVGKLDIDAEIVGIEFEIVALEQPGLLVDIHQQRRDVAVDLELPMPIARRLGLEIDPRLAVRQRPSRGVFRARSSQCLDASLRSVYYVHHGAMCRLICIIIHDSRNP